MGNVTERVKIEKEKLDSVQTKPQADPLSSNLIQEERKAMNSFINASKAEESLQRQKSREQMITLGDNNTEYFFRLVQARRFTYKILCVVDDQGKALEDVKLIGDACEKYYKNLYAP